jgi:SAM-dependent methyltransferase
MAAGRVITNQTMLTSNATQIGETSFSEVLLGQEIPWIEVDKDRHSFQRRFVKLLLDIPGFQGRVLDIGCGSALPEALKPITGRYGSLDGVDPSDGIEQHRLLEQRWNAPFEASDIPANAYDLAYTYNVLEHLADPAPFFRKLHSVLKPGGVFFALTPNGFHPFAVLSRSIELIGLKPYARQKIGHGENGAMAVNNYPAYYRCNTPTAVARAIRGLNFKQVTCYYFPCLQWDTFFAKALRWMPGSTTSASAPGSGHSCRYSWCDSRSNAG